jgi:hypothetical protein
VRHIKKDCEVLVVGAGVAGIGAAVSAARQGAHTILVEENSFPGGAAVIGLHRFTCGLYINGTAMPDNTLNEGVVREICSRLKHLAPGKTAMRMGKVYVLPYLTENLVSVFNSLIREENHLDVLYNTQAVSVKTEQISITAVTVRYLEEEFDIIPRVVIDCSGDGIIVQLSGARYQLSPPHLCQFAGYTFRVKGLQNVNDMIAINVPYCLTQAVTEKKMPFYLKFTTFTPGDAPDEGYCKLSIPPVGERDRNEQARNDALLVQRYLSQMLPIFRDSYIAELSKGVINREGPRVYGEYTLSADDVLSARKFSDGVVKNAWPIELWDQEKGPHYQYLNPGDFYEIPLRCLKAQDISNLYCAGRCISVSREALGSTRVMGTCISLGEQAGREAVTRNNL